MANRDAERLLALTEASLPELWAAPRQRARDLHRLGAGRYADLVRIAAAEAGRDPRGALADALAAASTWEPKRLPVGGDDLLALGLPAGPRLGALLAALEAWWVAHDFAPDRAACLAEARRLLAADDAGVPDA
jgi:poly(A) polymerase